ncbi:putative hydrolase [Nostocoides japonicum T1-X7]|uniref:Putative hydrolase n=1 Tax=Nostocoides japonicum T1-X7 TaxID=1194083 RepID=A0A077M1N9_9MICO|nr:alpha/beta hydrolase [Tetrasphaera japonica]CCH78135.1 putative hydrolase [Tetrasphaera japonica T1-X7]
MSSATVNGITIEYDVHGPDDGETVLLVMGLATQMIAWPSAFIEHLTDAGYRVVRFDNRDIGLSSKTQAPLPTRKDVMKALASSRLAHSDYLLSHMAADAIGLLDHLGVDRVHVVGASMGGMIAQEIAIGYPQRVRSLVSIMSNTGDRRHGRVGAKLLPQLRKTLLAAPPRTREEAVDRGVLAWRQIAGPHFDEQYFRALVVESLERSTDSIGSTRQLLAIQASPDRTPALRHVTAPTLVVHGLRDKLVLPSGGIATARAVPGSRLLMFPDMGHDLPTPRLAEIAGAIVENARRGA